MDDIVQACISLVTLRSEMAWMTLEIPVTGPFAWGKEEEASCLVSQGD